MKSISYRCIFLNIILMFFCFESNADCSRAITGALSAFFGKKDVSHKSVNPKAVPEEYERITQENVDIKIKAQLEKEKTWVFGRDVKDSAKGRQALMDFQRSDVFVDGKKKIFHSESQDTNEVFKSMYKKNKYIQNVHQGNFGYAEGSTKTLFDDANVAFNTRTDKTIEVKGGRSRIEIDTKNNKYKYTNEKEYRNKKTGLLYADTKMEVRQNYRTGEYITTPTLILKKPSESTVRFSSEYFEGLRKNRRKESSKDRRFARNVLGANLKKYEVQHTYY